jgi:hypothetical protein
MHIYRYICTEKRRFADFMRKEVIRQESNVNRVVKNEASCRIGSCASNAQAVVHGNGVVEGAVVNRHILTIGAEGGAREWQAAAAGGGTSGGSGAATSHSCRI